jgi:hypothetical protein
MKIPFLSYQKGAPTTGAPHHQDISNQDVEPPALVQSSAVGSIIKPFPLQAFCPLQELFALLHAPWPLQELIPKHCTPELAASANAEVAGTPANAIAATASAAPIIFLFLLIIYSLINERSFLYF